MSVKPVSAQLSPLSEERKRPHPSVPAKRGPPSGTAASVRTDASGRSVLTCSQLSPLSREREKLLEESDNISTKIGECDTHIAAIADEIESWVLDELKAIGCDTAKSVLNLSVEDLVKRTDLEEETIKDLVNVLKAEFE